MILKKFTEAAYKLALNKGEWKLEFPYTEKTIITRKIDDITAILDKVRVNVRSMHKDQYVHGLLQLFMLISTVMEHEGVDIERALKDMLKGKTPHVP